MTGPLAVLQYPQINPVIFHIGNIAIRWYGMAYLAGFLLGYYLLLQLGKRGSLHLVNEQIADLMQWLALAVIVGGRVGWLIFYDHNLPGPKPWWEPIAIWHGGMSFHGGLIGVILIIWFWTRKYKAPFLNICDCMALVAPIGLFLGRLANFVNMELIGKPSTLPWAVQFPGYDLPRHPSQIYEAILEGPILMALLWALKFWKNRRDGQIAAAFVFWYAIFRFLVEFVREPDSQLNYIAFGWLTMGQILSAAIGVGAIVGWVMLRNGEKARIYKISPPATNNKKVAQKK